MNSALCGEESTLTAFPVASVSMRLVTVRFAWTTRSLAVLDTRIVTEVF
jgi:hypothetical protein